MSADAANGSARLFVEDLPVRWIRLERQVVAPPEMASQDPKEGAALRTRRAFIVTTITVVAVPLAAAAGAVAAPTRGFGHVGIARAGPPMAGKKVVVGTTASRSRRALFT